MPMNKSAMYFWKPIWRLESVLRMKTFEPLQNTFLWKVIWLNTRGINATINDNVGATLIIMTMANNKGKQ
jgi:hypothetical protein